MANAYLRMKQRTEEARFDIIAIEINGIDYHLNHIENAFTSIDVWFHSRIRK